LSGERRLWVWCQPDYGKMMRTTAVILGVLVTQSAAWSKTPAAERPRPDDWQLRPSEQLLTTPPVIVQFGWTASDVSGLIEGLSASAAPQVIVAETGGVLEYICSPRSIVPWGAALFRIYECDLLSDLRRAEEAAARIGDLPVIVAPRTFPSPMTWTPASLAPPPPILQGTRAQETPGPIRVPSGPLVRLPRSGSVAATPGPHPSAPAPRAQEGPSGTSLREASRKLASADERVGELAAMAEAAAAALRAAEQAAAPLREDVAARRRLADAGVIARNDVKAAEERLAEATAAVAAAAARVTEAEGALRAARAGRDAALSDLQQARSAGAAPNPPPEQAARRPTQTPAGAPPPRRVEPVAEAVPSGVPLEASVPEFPSPATTGDDPLLDEVPPPEHSFRLAPRRDVPDLGAWEPLPLPDEADELTRPRWRDQTAPWQCVVSRSLVPQGARVTEGTPALEVRQTNVGRVRAEIDEQYVSYCRVGVPVKVTFPGNGSAFLGWISRVEPTRSPRPPGALVEMLLVKGLGSEASIYESLEWMALTAPILPETPDPLTYRPARPVRPSPTDLPELFPLGPAGTVEPSVAPAPPDGQLSGSLQVVSAKRPKRFVESDHVAARKLRKLQDWRESFIEGMKTTIFPESGLTLTYAREGDTCRAVERMATRRVSHVPNMCARTLAEALGWSLGDAAMWAQRLPDRGYSRRADGIARPGDIVVWPFTYGPSRAQHIGVAVAQGEAMMLLSNEGGVLCTTPLKGGYLAFHKPRPGDAFSGADCSARATRIAAQLPPDRPQ